MPELIAEERVPLSESDWHDGLGLRESDLAEIWRRQSFPQGALSLADGRSLRVLLPGRQARSAGPDFRDALVEIDGREQRGDVELHLEAPAFRSHGHHLDPAYSRIALHVVIWSRGEIATQLVDGTTAPVAAFGPWLAGRSQEIAAWLSGDRLWREPCETAAGRLGDPAVSETLRSQGERRLASKTARLAQASEEMGQDQAFWSALLNIIGQGGDRTAWHRLADAVTPALLRTGGTEEDTARSLLSAAGLTHGPEAKDSPKKLFKDASGGRPQNRPERRLLALAEIWRRAEGDLPSFARESVRSAASAQELLQAWSVGRRGARQALLGRDKAEELVLNVVLPFAAMTPNLAEQASRLAAQLPALPVYGKTRQLEANLAKSGGGRRVQLALEQQGLLAMHTDWCSQGGCGRCPLS